MTRAGLEFLQIRSAHLLVHAPELGEALVHALFHLRGERGLLLHAVERQAHGVERLADVVVQLAAEAHAARPTEEPSKVRLTWRSCSARARAACSSARATVRSLERRAICSTRPPPGRAIRGGGQGLPARLVVGQPAAPAADDHDQQRHQRQQQREQHDGREDPLVEHLDADERGDGKRHARLPAGRVRDRVGEGRALPRPAAVSGRAGFCPVPALHRAAEHRAEFALEIARPSCSAAGPLTAMIRPEPGRAVRRSATPWSWRASPGAARHCSVTAALAGKSSNSSTGQANGAGVEVHGGEARDPRTIRVKRRARQNLRHTPSGGYIF